MKHLRHIYVALSGGVDSSVAALLLQRAGYRVTGVYMKNWSELLTGQVETRRCSWEEELDTVRTVAEHLDIPYRSVNFERAYRAHVFSAFVDAYRAGRTPNPDVACNREIKFRRFLSWALAQGADGIATGHYVRTRRRAGQVELLRGRDRNKDQSYFLYGLTQDALRVSHFPIGALTKPRVRQIARRAGLPNADRPDSQGICFVGHVRLGTFLAPWLGHRTGPIKDARGRVVGSHTGAWQYTIGQRHGLGVGGGSPHYVLRTDTRANSVTVTTTERDLFSTMVRLDRPHWVSGKPLSTPAALHAQPRYRTPAAAATLTQERGRWTLTYTRPQRALTPGQAVVFYRGTVVLGGATIRSSVKPPHTVRGDSSRMVEYAA